MAKKFAIMRGDKLHTGEMRGSIAHVSRSQNTPNADPSKRHLNYAVVGPAWDDARAIQAAVEQQTPKKYRRDAVRLLEYIVTASPEWFSDNPDKIEAYFESATAFFQEEYGVENVVSAVVHHDETSPHMHLYAVPIDPRTGNLNAKKLFGGRGDMSRRQSRFAEHMQDFGVERGKPNPNRKHTKIKDWRAGHSQLDEREAALQDREKSASAQLQEARIFHGDAREQLQAAWKTEEANEAQSHQLAAERKTLDERAQVLAEREQRLAALERELVARGDKLSSGENALEQRQAEIDRAGSILRQKLDAARVAQQQFEQQKAAWIAENRPTLPPVVQHLKHLETLGVLASAEYLEAQNDDRLYDLFSPQEGFTEKGRALLDQYKNVQERAEKFEETFTPSSVGPGL